jgi:hypothetical protein
VAISINRAEASGAELRKLGNNIWTNWIWVTFLKTRGVLIVKYVDWGYTFISRLELLMLNRVVFVAVFAGVKGKKGTGVAKLVEGS